jgi:hypothetical protein
MSEMTEHPDVLLSAYLDDALTAEERASVRAHLEACALCRARLDDLGITSRLIAALPALAPARSLVPRIERGPVWLRPVRLLGSMGTGVFLFLFLASAVLNSGSNLGGGTSTAERLAAKGDFGGAASALASENARKAVGPTNAPAAPAAGSQATLDQSRSAISGTSAAPSAPAAFAVATGTVTSLTTEPARPPFGPSPGLFLGLALGCAVVAFVAHRRLRRT